MFVRAMRMQVDCHLRVFKKFVNLHNTKMVLTTLVCIAACKPLVLHLCQLLRLMNVHAVSVPQLYVPACDAPGANSLSCKVKV